MQQQHTVAVIVIAVVRKVLRPPAIVVAEAISSASVSGVLTVKGASQ